MISLPAKKKWKPGQVQIVLAIRDHKGTTYEFKAPRVRRATMDFILKLLKDQEPYLEPGDGI